MPRVGFAILNKFIGYEPERLDIVDSNSPLKPEWYHYNYPEPGWYSVPLELRHCRKQTSPLPVIHEQEECECGFFYKGQMMRTYDYCPKKMLAGRMDRAIYDDWW